MLEKTSEQNKLNDTNKTLESISEALSLMSNKVLEQELLSSSFKDIGQTGLYYIDRGNTNLIEANMLSKESGKYWSMLFILLALSLLVLDWFKS